MKLFGLVLVLILAMTKSISLASPVSKPCGKPADVVFVIDSSSSIWPGDFKRHAIPFIKDVVSSFDIGEGPQQTRVGALTYSSDIRMEFHLNAHHNPDQLLHAISRLKVRGGDTYTDKALNFASENMFQSKHGARSDVAHIIIVLTDGRSSNNPSTVVEAEKARQSGVAIFAIGVGAAEDKELSQIASKPDSQFKFKVTDFAALQSIKEELALKTCEVTMPTTTTTTTTTTPPPRTECGGKPADVFFILDSSSSIWRQDFEKRVVGFVHDTVTNFDIGEDLTRVGVMTFSDDPRIVIALDSYNNKKDLLKAISPSVVKYTLGGTNTADAIRDVRKIGFSASPREDVTKIAVVITDGQSWNERETKKQAALLKDSGVMVYAIGVGKGVKKEELEAIANDPKEDYVFNVDGFSALSELRDVLAIKACGDTPQNDEPVCGSGPTELTFAFDPNTMTLRERHNALEQIKTISERLENLAGDIQLGVTSGTCAPSMDMQLSNPKEASHQIRLIKKTIKPNLHAIVKEWRNKEVSNTLDVKGINKFLGISQTDASTKKALVILLNGENMSEFAYISEEVQLLIENGVEIFMVLDETVGRSYVDSWVELLGNRRVISKVTVDSDYSGYIMEFLCSL